MKHATSQSPIGFRTLHADANFNYQLNRFLGSEPDEELRAIAADISDFASWVRVLWTRADALEAGGEGARAARYVRAAELFMAPGTSEKVAAYRRYVELFWAQDRPWDRLEVPFAGRKLPTLRARGPRGEGAPKLVVFGGYESFIEELVELATPWEHEGFDVVLFEGPGQGSALLDQGLAMVPDWERPLGAVLDALDLDDVTVVGFSLGGYWALRAAAFEPRIRRVVAFDVMFDFFATLLAHGGPALQTVVPRMLGSKASRALLDAALRKRMEESPLAAWGLGHAMHVTATRTPADALRQLRAYTMRDISDRVTQDVLILAGREDHHVPFSQLGAQVEALVNARSITTRVFSAAEHAASHCQIGNLPLATALITSWVRERTAAAPRE